MKPEYVRFAWPAAAVLIVGMVLLFLRDRPTERPLSIEVRPSNTVVKEIRSLGRLETAAVHVEKVIDMKDTQQRLYGLVEAKDALLFVAVGEVLVGVDLGRLGDGDVTYDETTKVASIVLPQPEVLSTRFDEQKSHVHARETDTLAKRNEDLEGAARREATKAFADAGKDPAVVLLAKENAKKQLEALAKAWGAVAIEVTWKTPSGEMGAGAK